MLVRRQQPHSTEGKPRPRKGEPSTSVAGRGLDTLSYGAVGLAPPGDAQEQERESGGHMRNVRCAEPEEVPDHSRGW